MDVKVSREKAVNLCAKLHSPAEEGQASDEYEFKASQA
jgi:hypothetical protein